MSKQKFLENFKNKFYKKFPDSIIEIIEWLPDEKVLVKDKFGICKVTRYSLMIGNKPSIKSAINKTEYFINEAISKHGNVYSYDLVEYNGAFSKVKIICKHHGVFEQRCNDHLHNKGCPNCSLVKGAKKRTFTKEEFVTKANNVHNFKYDYPDDYKKYKIKIRIVCKIHGDFLQYPGNHLKGSGCPKCRDLDTSIRNKQNPPGWSYTNWENKARSSKNFDSFKVYILKCMDLKTGENFYKIGKTFKTLKGRFKQHTDLPYKWECLELYMGYAKDISKLETDLKNKHKKFKYVPKIKFNGMYECFSKIVI